LGREEGFVSQVSHHDTQRVPVDRFILPSQLCDPHNRDAIANALQEDDAQIPENLNRAITTIRMFIIVFI
jgi:hypothetical protein